MVAGKSKFATLNRPGTITHVFVPESVNSSVDDETVTAHAVEMISRYQPGLLFIHYPGVDQAGHSIGWGSNEQLAAASGIVSSEVSAEQAYGAHIEEKHS